MGVSRSKAQSKQSYESAIVLRHITQKTRITLECFFSWRFAVEVGSLSKRVFETRTATGSELFSLLTCPHTTTFTLLSIFSPLEMIRVKIWETPLSRLTKCSFPVAVRVSKTRVLKLPHMTIFAGKTVLKLDILGKRLTQGISADRGSI